MLGSNEAEQNVCYLGNQDKKVVGDECELWKNVAKNKKHPDAPYTKHIIKSNIADNFVEYIAL